VVSGACFALNIVVDAVINAAANAAELSAMAMIILHAYALPDFYFAVIPGEIYFVPK